MQYNCAFFCFENLSEPNNDLLLIITTLLPY